MVSKDKVTIAVTVAAIALVVLAAIVFLGRPSNKHQFELEGVGTVAFKDTGRVSFKVDESSDELVPESSGFAEPIMPDDVNGTKHVDV